EIEVASGGTLDLQDDQFWSHNFSGEQLHVLAGGTLTRTSAAGTDAANVGVPFDNDGTVEVTAGNLSLTDTFANYDAGTDILTGGAYKVRNGALFQFNDADVRNNRADITLDGAGSAFWDGSQDGMRNLNANSSTGDLTLLNDRNFTRTGAFTNNGGISLDDETKFTATGNYTQGSTGSYETDISGQVAGAGYGQLVVGGTANLNGTLGVDVSAHPPETGEFFDVLTGTRNGTFSTVNGDGFEVKNLADLVRITPPELTIGNRSVTEGDAGTQLAQFRVDLSSPSAATVTVDYQTANGSATAPADYTATSGTLTFNPGQTTKFVNVPVTGDALDEPNKKFTVNLSNPAFADIADASGEGTIVDNDPAPTISVTDSPRKEGNARHKFVITLSAPSAQVVRVDYTTQDGTANAPGDYTAKSGTLTFNPGVTSKLVLVDLIDDSVDEATEQFTLELSNPQRATIADGTGVGEIRDNDGPSISISDASRNEGSSTALSFQVTLSAPSPEEVRVDYATQDGTATAPADYTARSGRVTFQPGETSKNVNVNRVDDAIDEPNETFNVALSSPVNGTIADGTGIGTIIDND
ncbi:MAG: Calx-beta domain-containing protein, partial [Thermoleophilaceae bacterium]